MARRTVSVSVWILSISLFPVGVCALPDAARGDPLGAGEGTIYILNQESRFMEGCFSPCKCPMVEVPGVGGSFTLTYAGLKGAVHDYAVTEVNWRVPSSDRRWSVVGAGRYLIGTPDPATVLQHRMALELRLDNEPARQFDSGWVPVEHNLGISVSVSGNGKVCLDTAFVVDASRIGGDQCGGFGGEGCWWPDDFCKLPLGQCCCDVFGACTRIPTGCPDVWDPVCGCDGQTYGNECEADMAGVSVRHYGACEPVCKPAPDGFSCVNTGCSDIPEIQCRPMAVEFDAATGAMRVTKCDCIDFNQCHIELGNSGPLPTGKCPDGQACEIVGKDSNNDGVDDTFVSQCNPFGNVGVCCLDIDDGPVPFDSCLTLDEAACHLEGGLFHVADPNCDEAQACCLAFAGKSVCAELNPHCCVDSGGVPQGPGTTCRDPNWPAVCDRQCGGFAGNACLDTEFCKFPAGICGDAADHTGICVPVPEGCPEIYDPVCGCDGVTYGNECEADAARVSILHHAECETGACCGDMGGSPLPVPACFPSTPDTCDSQVVRFKGPGTVCEPQACCLPYGGDAACTDVDPFCCTAFMGVPLGPKSNCAEVQPAGGCGQTCNGLLGLPCGEDELCQFAPGTCHFADHYGVCRPLPNACPTVIDPVCGCDGVTYPNACEAHRAGISIDHRGKCARAPCCDPTEAPPCFEGVHCCANGEWQCDWGGGHDPCDVPGEVCPVLCGGFTGIHCGDWDFFCLLPPGICLDAVDLPGACMPRPDACPEIFDPVCGCDGVTYDNECFAHAHGMSLLHHGMCEGQPCVATRVLSDSRPTFCPGVAKTVRIELSPPDGASSLGIEDAPPAGWEVTHISHEGVFDPGNGKVKWGPLFAPFPAEVSYEVVPTVNANLHACFVGAVSVDGLNRPICGEECVELLCIEYMAADSPRPACAACPAGDCSACRDGACRDGRVSLCEVTGYACAWKAGCNDDLAGMTRAAYIWHSGECYCQGLGEPNWFPSECPPPLPPGFCPLHSEADGGTAEASISSPAPRTEPVRAKRSTRTRELKIPISLQAPAGARVLAVDCTVPEGWEVLAMTDGGAWDAAHRKVKWGPFFDALSRTVTLHVRHSGGVDPTQPTRVGSVRPNGFSATVSYDGVNSTFDIR